MATAENNEQINLFALTWLIVHFKLGVLVLELLCQGLTKNIVIDGPVYLPN